VKIKAIKKTIIGGETVYPGSILDVDDIVATKLIRRGYVQEIWELEEEAEENDNEPAADQ
jgi:hypothetical protein